MDFIPSVSARYLQILFPALDLCDAILTSLGTDNQSCTVQVWIVWHVWIYEYYW